MIEQAIARLWVVGPAAIAALALSAGLILLLRPALLRHALARPNARSSHRQPTPQGGGIAVMAATFAVAWGAVALSPALLADQAAAFLALTAAAALLAAVGAIDDVRPLPPAARLIVQFAAVGAAIAALPDDARWLPQVPWWAERAGLVVGGVWFVNLVNFMDGIDWITVAEVVPVAAALVLVGLIGGIGLMPAVVAGALLGATLGFAPFNKPVAKLFLGDVGSLPMGLLLAWLLLELAAKGHPAAAAILPLYYLADATITLARRIYAGERVWQAHRAHFYQRATDNGFAVGEVVARVFLTNLALAALALASVVVPTPAAAAAALAAAAVLVAWLLASLARGRR